MKVAPPAKTSLRALFHRTGANRTHSVIAAPVEIIECSGILMDSFLHRLLLRIAACFLLPSVMAVGATPVIPLESFFAEPARAVALSPDGHYAAYLALLGNSHIGIALFDLTTGRTDALVAPEDEDIKHFVWKGSDTIVYGGDMGGDESPWWWSIAIKPKPDGRRTPVPLARSISERTIDADSVRVVDELKFDPEHLLVFGRREPGASSVGVYLMDVRTGKRRPVTSYSPPRSSNSFQAFYDTENIADNNGVLRARSRLEDKTIIYEIRPTPTSGYTKMAEFPAENSPWEFLFFAADNETLYFLNREKSDTATLQTLNVRTREISPPLFNSPDGEIESVLTSWDRSKLYGVSYVTEKRHYQFVDPNRASLQKSIDEALPQTSNIIVSTSQDEKTLIVLAASDRDPGTYYTLNHGRLSPFLRSLFSVDPTQMQPMEPISYAARDGLIVHGYLTRPRNATSPVPLIINPHGGPYGIRDNWGFNPEVQFLANRGYAILQVNYRGSGGYGQRFQKAGYHEWGAKMQDDLTDAVRWAIEQQIADPRRVMIYGASYGGYAALAGLVFTPELYCCGINYVGPSDLSLLVAMGRNDGLKSLDLFYKEEVGTDRDLLRARSPVNFIERLQAPLLNAYGYNDPRVNFQQWTSLKSKLDHFKKPYEIIIEKNEGHGFRNETNRLVYYRSVEAFLQKWLTAGR